MLLPDSHLVSHTRVLVPNPSFWSDPRAGQTPERAFLLPLKVCCSPLGVAWFSVSPDSSPKWPPVPCHPRQTSLTTWTSSHHPLWVCPTPLPSHSASLATQASLHPGPGLDQLQSPCSAKTQSGPSPEQGLIAPGHSARLGTPRSLLPAEAPKGPVPWSSRAGLNPAAE